MAISLSGGGYRAAAFHLGALSYLHIVNHEGETLLERIKIISTISGGTFTGVQYALKLAEGQGFQACFSHLYALLRKDALVTEALHLVNHPHEWSAKGKTHNLINAFSEIYQRDYCQGATLAALLAGPLGHLETFAFNATDMYNTLPFRFQNGGKLGNGEVSVDWAAAAEIRLGDVMAASSCFPGGFEPLAFPKDFAAGPKSALMQYWQSQPDYPANIPLLDGGILDNQGIESVELAEKRRIKDGHPPIGTFIVSDVSEREPAPLDLPQPPGGGLLGWLTLTGLRRLLALLLVLAGLGVVFSWGARPGLLVLSALAGFLSLAFFAIIGFGERKLSQAVVQEVDNRAERTQLMRNLRVIRKTPLSVLWQLVSVRLFSLSDILQNTFMARIRRLQFRYLYNSDNWKGRLVSNNIYSLATNAAASEAGKLPPMPKPSAAMMATAKLAAAMPTALWFSTQEEQEGMLDALIIAGQINLCYQLLLHLRQDVKATADAGLLSAAVQSSLKDLEQAILNDFNQFVVNEKWLLQELKV